MTLLDSLLDGAQLRERFDAASHPRGWHGRWVGTSRGKVLRVFHDSAHVGDVHPKQEGAPQEGGLMAGVAQVARDAGRSITPAETRKLLKDVKGSPEPTPRVIPKGGSANEMRGGIPMLKTPGPAKFNRGDKVRVLGRSNVVKGVHTVVRRSESQPSHLILQPPNGGPHVLAHEQHVRSAVDERASNPSMGKPADDLMRARAGQRTRELQAFVQGRPPSSATPKVEPNGKAVHDAVSNLAPGKSIELRGSGIRVQRTPASGFRVNVDGTSLPVKSPHLAARHALSLHRQRTQEAAPASVLGALLEGAVLSERFVAQAKRDELASKGHALKVGGKVVFPIETKDDASNAATLWKSGHHKTEAARKHIVRNARRVGALGVVKDLSNASDPDGDGDNDSSSAGDTDSDKG